LLKLTLPKEEIQKCYVRSLSISAFLTIFDTLAKFIPDFNFDENALKFALDLVYVSDDFTYPKQEKEDTHSVSRLYFQELLNPYFMKNDESSESDSERSESDSENSEQESKTQKYSSQQNVIKSVLIFQKTQEFAKIFEQYIDTIVNSIELYSFIEVVNRIILFTKSNKITMASIQKHIKEQLEEDVKSLDEVLLVDEYDEERENEDDDENDNENKDGNYGGEDNEDDNWGDDTYEWENSD
jgi:hypothetical protein